MGHATMPGTTFYNMQCPQQHESQYHDLNDYHQQSDDADSTASTLSSDETEDIMHQREQQQNFNRHGHAQYTYWDQTLPNQTPGHAQPQPRPQPQPQAWHETMWTPNHQREYVKHLYQTQNGTSWQETPPQWAGSEPKAQAQIVHVGEGTTVAGQRSEDFADSAQVSLCYQCCKQYVGFVLFFFFFALPQAHKQFLCPACVTVELLDYHKKNTMTNSGTSTCLYSTLDSTHTHPCYTGV
jgi:hypothetical protein